MILSDNEINKLIDNANIINSQRELQSEGQMSYGVSSYGYDIVLDNTIYVMKMKLDEYGRNFVIDPKKHKKDCWILHENVKKYIDIPPHGFILGHSKEFFKMPSDVTAIVQCKSSYARCGVICLNTVIEAGWEGQLTLEFANVTDNAVRMYVNEGCCQILFFKGKPCDVTYAMRNGKYQHQKGVTFSTV